MLSYDFYSDRIENYSDAQHIPICFKTDDMDESVRYPFFNVFNGTFSVKLYINNHITVPAGWMFYDYFGSGEVYVNPNIDIEIFGISESFGDLYKNHFADNGFFTKYSEKITDTFESIGSYKIPEISPINGWLIPISKYALYEHKNIKDILDEVLQIDSSAAPVAQGTLVEAEKYFLSTPLNNKMASLIKEMISSRPVDQVPFENKPNFDPTEPICCNFNYTDNKDIDHSAENYQFANRIPFYPTCSSSKRKDYNKVFTGCHYEEGSRRNCSFYEPMSQTITNVHITPKNSSNVIDISMHYEKGVDNKTRFKIVNKTDDVVITKFESSNDISYDESISEAQHILDEVISCYTDHEINSNTNIVEEIFVEKQSFIKTLLKV